MATGGRDQKPPPPPRRRHRRAKEHAWLHPLGAKCNGKMSDEHCLASIRVFGAV